MSEPSESKASSSDSSALASDVLVKRLFMHRPAWMRYGVAGVATGIAFFVVRAAEPWLGQQVLMTPFLVVVMALACWVGPGPGFFATIFSALLVDWFVLTPGTLI